MHRASLGTKGDIRSEGYLWSLITALPLRTSSYVEVIDRQKMHLTRKILVPSSTPNLLPITGSSVKYTFHFTMIAFTYLCNLRP
jgi:hypothetical protein